MLFRFLFTSYTIHCAVFRESDSGVMLVDRSRRSWMATSLPLKITSLEASILLFPARSCVSISLVRDSCFDTSVTLSMRASISSIMALVLVRNLSFSSFRSLRSCRSPTVPGLIIRIAPTVSKLSVPRRTTKCASFPGSASKATPEYWPRLMVWESGASTEYTLLLSMGTAQISMKLFFMYSEAFSLG